jgi:uncharacterized membrane protein YfhO
MMRADSPLLDLLNVKYMLSEQELDGRWELVHRSAGDVDVYQNQDVLPRAFVVHRIEVVDTPGDSLDRTTDPTFDFRAAAVLEEQPKDWPSGSTQMSEDSPSNAVVRIVAHRPNKVTMDVDTATPGLLVLTDTYAPGWRAFLDGEATPVYVADHAFRAIVVPAGAHRVEFVYRPLSFWIGAGISVLAVLTALSALLLAGIMRGTKPVPKDSQDG